jgi:hypothetical protein
MEFSGKAFIDSIDKSGGFVRFGLGPTVSMERATRAFAPAHRAEGFLGAALDFAED